MPARLDDPAGRFHGALLLSARAHVAHFSLFASVSIRQHPSAYVSILGFALVGSCSCGALFSVCIRQHASAYVSIRGFALVGSCSCGALLSVCIRQHPSASVSIRQHTSAYGALLLLARVNVALFCLYADTYIAILDDRLSY